jgi:hypothetical protein
MRTSTPGEQSRSVKSSTMPDFWQSYHALPQNVRGVARKTYQLWQANPNHGSLHWKPLAPGFGRSALVYNIAHSRESAPTPLIGFGSARTTISTRSSNDLSPADKHRPVRGCTWHVFAALACTSYGAGDVEVTRDDLRQGECRVKRCTRVVRATKFACFCCC